ncbi:MAG: tRNA 2-thiouridine(34) synthase MnmA [Bacillota bacterium]|nr:tRNA 2-thiouridine(34) synthase MnmA [Bacillota bacterium]
MRVVAAMSGGVDSSVAAALLVEQGYEVIGVTLQIWQARDPGAQARLGGCCSLGAVSDARRVAELLGIPYYVLNLQEAFRRSVIDDFVREYARGRTPNPCIVCNREIKFAALLERARELGADYVASGHYARVAWEPERRRWTLRRGRDPRKDQSYVLYPLGQEQLAHVLFPLGEMEKAETRRLAAELGLPVASKPESQEICFVQDDDYAGFLEQEIPDRFRPGPIVDRAGRRLGTHRGLPRYTVGQRRGLGVAAGEPLYVLEVDAAANRLVVGTAREAERSRFEVAPVTWVSEAPPAGDAWQEATVQIRAHAPVRPVRYRLSREDPDRLELELLQPVRAVTPGQSAVLYRGDEVVAGGPILRVLE